MLDPIEKWQYRGQAGVPNAKEYLEHRLKDRKLLPLSGLHGERLLLTGFSELTEKVSELAAMYENIRVHRGVKDIILLDALNSATIEGARTTVAQVKNSASDPRTKDDRMVVNTMKGMNYGFRTPVTEKNIRTLWETVVAGVCENEEHKGSLYRDGMVYIGDPSRTIHTPAKTEQLPELMHSLFAYEDPENPLIASFAAHFYFVYVHPFCDGNGRTARILNSSRLYHGGFTKMKNLALSTAINDQLSGYYSSLKDSEKVLRDSEGPFLDLSPFVSYMLDAFERCLIHAVLSDGAPTEKEALLLKRMNRVGKNAEITAKKAKQILDVSESTVRRTLTGLVQKGYLTVDTRVVPYIYRLQQHIPE